MGIRFLIGALLVTLMTTTALQACPWQTPPRSTKLNQANQDEKEDPRKKAPSTVDAKQKIENQDKTKGSDSKSSELSTAESEFNPIQSEIPATPPANALILLDATTNQFLSRDGATVDWPVSEGIATSSRKAGNVNHIVSKIHFRDADIHVEFKLPEKGKGNSGIYIHGNYECQIINSFGKQNPDMNDMGSVYGIQKPLTNASRKPGQWQVYDIRFRAPTRDQSGTIIKEGSITAFLNGQKVQNETKLGEPRSKFHPFRHGTTAYLKKIGKTKNKTMTGPLFLQDHSAPVQFRNVWIVPLDDQSFEYKPN